MFRPPPILCLPCVLWGALLSAAHAQSTLDTIGVTALWAADPALTGSGVIVGQVEEGNGALDFEVNPSAPGQPGALFSYRSAAGTAAGFPNHAGTESTHADQVAEAFYGRNTGVSPDPRHVNNSEANYFYGAVIKPRAPLNTRLFNQSFAFGPHDAAQDLAYDDYIASYHSVFVTAVGDGGAIMTPGDCYNGIGVGAYGGETSTGPTADGRCKPDITAPAGATSFSAPLVAGAAAILIQDGRRLGADSRYATDSRTVKALLLNGAVKPSGWTQTSTAPLDPNYGAGILNVFNSHVDLSGGRHSPVAKDRTHAAGHAPLAGGRAISVPQGWDYQSIESGASEAAINHYRITTTAAGALIATLVWNKGYRANAINNLGLYIYDDSGDLLASSVSTVDNVQHVYVTGLTPSTYEIEVVKPAGVPGAAGVAARGEVYALAWDFER